LYLSSTFSTSDVARQVNPTCLVYLHATIQRFVLPGSPFSSSNAYYRSPLLCIIHAVAILTSSTSSSHLSTGEVQQEVPISISTSYHPLYPSPKITLHPAPLNEAFQGFASLSSTQLPTAPSLFTLWNFYD
ncbi:hypothetical protein CEXT_429881, partial [Caerostris extrusa]